MGYDKMTKKELIEEMEMLCARVNELEAVHLQLENSEQRLLEAKAELARINRELEVEIVERQRFEKALREHAHELAQTNGKLEDALARITTLQGLPSHMRVM